jgi:hypothetical protein
LIPEIGIWRAAQLILKRYGEQELEESADRAEELALAGDAKFGRELLGAHSSSFSSKTIIASSQPGQAAARLQ